MKPIFRPYKQIDSGFGQVAHLLGMALGPGSRSVFHATMGGGTERLTDSAMIAQRISALSGRNQGENVGAMLLREMVKAQRATYGDGAGTAALLAFALLQQGRKLQIAGFNPNSLRQGIMQGAEIVCNALDQRAIPAAGQAQLTAFATSVTGNPKLGAILGELFDVLGADGAVTVEQVNVPYLNHDYLDGGRWRIRPAARMLIPDGKRELVLDNPVILVADQQLGKWKHVAQAFQLTADQFEKRPLLIVARGIKDEALEAITVNHAQGKLTIGAGVVMGATADLADVVRDLAIATGAEVASLVRGRPPEQIPAHALGSARRAIMTRERLTIVGGAGESAQKQARVAELRGQFRRINRAKSDPKHTERSALQKRIARLSGGMGIVKVGAHTKRERQAIVASAESAIHTIELALAEGLIAGGGAGLLACRGMVIDAAKSCDDPAISQGIRLMADALSAPMTQLMCNAGQTRGAADYLVAQCETEPGLGFDMAQNRMVNMVDAGILDSVAVLKGAVRAAGSCASMALMTECVLLR